MAHRALRRAENIAVAVLVGIEHMDPLVGRTGRKVWKKVPNAPLVEFVGRKPSR